MKIRIAVDSTWLLSGDGKHAGVLHRLEQALEEKWSGQITRKEVSIADCEIECSKSPDLRETAREIRELVEQITGEAFDEKIFHVTIETDGKQATLGNDGLTESTLVRQDLLDQINALRKARAAEEPAAGHTEASGAIQSTPTQETPSKGPAGPVKEEAAPAQQAEAAQEGMVPEKEAKKQAEKKKVSAYESIQNLVGNQAFKQLAEDIRSTAAQTIKHGTQSIFFSEAYLFAVDTGSGYHTSLELLNSLLQEVGLFTNNAKPESIAIPAFTDHEMVSKMKTATEVLETALEKQRLITIDISEWIGHTHLREFKNLAMQAFRKNRQCVMIFRIPYVKENVVDATVRDLSDIISTRPVVFAPFTGEELQEIAQRYLDLHRFQLTDRAWEGFCNRMDAEREDGSFYGIHTVHKVVGDLIRRKEITAARTGAEDRIIAEDLVQVLPAAQAVLENLDTLREMIGMEDIYRQVVGIINQIVFSRTGSMKNRPTMHMCFVGNPGTGKTTVARIIGHALKERGVLRIGKFYEHHGRDLCAEYVGQTAPRTRAICREAYGSVLFIDEAYSLAAGGDQRYDYGREAIDTLVTEMENNGDDLIVIFAGYPDEIQKMIDLNPGMRSRIPYTIEFPNYTREQLAQIFMKMVRESFSCTADLEKKAGAFFDAIPDEVMEDKTFGNGRFVRNLFERCWGKAIARSSESGFDGLTISGEDFAEATREMDWHDQQAHGGRKIGF